MKVNNKTLQSFQFLTITYLRCVLRQRTIIFSSKHNPPLLVLLIVIRYDLGNTLACFTLFRSYLGFLLATVAFVELNFILRYAQIHVWGCVKEINEDLAMTATGISVLCVSLATGYCMTLNPPMWNFFMTYSQCVFH